MKRVVIRCDSNARDGIGHLVRALSVALAARDAGWVAVIAGDISTDLARSMVADARIEVIRPRDDLGEVAIEQKASIVHIDSYVVGLDALGQVRAAGAVLSSMEDGVFGRRPADIVIDSSVGAESVGSISMTRPDDGSRLVLRGIEYAPMRPEVLSLREIREHHAARDREKEPASPSADGADILLVVGGTDATGAAATIASICQGATGVAEVAVIAPVERWDSIRATAPNARLLKPSSDFLRRAAVADLVVSAAGTTMWELACIGAPSLMVAVTENQIAGYKAAIAKGVAKGLGTIDQVRSDPAGARRQVEKAVEALRAGRSWNAVGMRVVDGHGAGRIVASWEAWLAERDLGRSRTNAEGSRGE